MPSLETNHYQNQCHQTKPMPEDRWEGGGGQRKTNAIKCRLRVYTFINLVRSSQLSKANIDSLCQYKAVHVVLLWHAAEYKKGKYSALIKP